MCIPYEDLKKCKLSEVEDTLVSDWIRACLEDLGRTKDDADKVVDDLSEHTRQELLEVTEDRLFKALSSIEPEKKRRAVAGGLYGRIAASSSAFSQVSWATTIIDI
eukprot:2802378-Amphidinium_carterae.1